MTAVAFGYEGETWFTAAHDFEELLREPGEYTYFCTLHGSADGSGMAGRIVVT
jgi:plastocyanin